MYKTSLFVYLFVFFVRLDYVGYQILFCLSYRTSFMLQNFIFIAVSTHSHITCHCEAHSAWALYIHSLGICFFLYKNLISLFKLYKLPVQCTLTQDALYTSPGWSPYRSYIVTFVYTIKET